VRRVTKVTLDVQVLPVALVPVVNQVFVELPGPPVMLETM